jgi:hypothetical protein
MQIATMQIKDLLKRDLDEKIEEIIKVDQSDEETVYRELTEYVATSRIREHYRTLLKAMAEAPAHPNEGVGIWISGFFGSGKSSFAKNLGYVLANRTVLGRRAADLFKAQLEDPEISALVDFITGRIPTEVMMFDVSVDRAVRNPNQKIAEIMYAVLLRHLGYAQDFDIAELEIELEGDRKLEEFERRCLAREGKPWQEVRVLSTRMSRASAILHEMDPRTFPEADSWARSRAGRSEDITVARFVENAFTLMGRRRPKKAFSFIIDEVGQYVARSADKIEDLRAVVERFGQESRNRVRARRAVAPVWIAVTSQEKLDEVVAAIDSRRVELARVQDRFSYRVDLAPADIREVATRRVLGKRPEAEPVLRTLFAQVQGQLNTACHLEHTERLSDVRAEEFVQFYPYLPHYIELSIDIMSGIRIQPGAPRHLGGSNRTIIKQAHEMLISPRTHLAKERIGTLVTMDLIYELVEGNLSSEKQKDISDIAERYKNDRQDRGWAARVAKTICLLEFVRNLPRTDANIAAMLVSQAGTPASLPEVQAALTRLERAQFIRRTDDGWKLQTAQEKRWDTERKGYLDPRPVERNQIKRDMLTELFENTTLRTYRHQTLQKSFTIGATADGTRITSGAIPLAIIAAADARELGQRLAEARTDSRSNTHVDEIFWVFALNAEVDELINQVYASSQMISKYNQVGAQGERAADLAPLLETERRELERLRRRLRDKLEIALAGGTGVFRGVAHDASSLGRTLPEILRSLFATAVPDLYPKLELGARTLRGSETEDFLKAANLNALPQIFYGGEHGLALVMREGGKSVINTSAEIAQEVLGHLNNKQRYGERVTGKDLEQHFTGIGYGWELDVIKLVLAVLLRAGAIEVTYQGHRFRNAQDPQCRTPLTSNPAFRNASFTPRDSIDLRMLTAAVRNYEELTGEEVDVEEGAIAEALKKFAAAELQQVLPVYANIRAYALPGGDILEEYHQMLTTIQSAASDDCVRTLAGEGRSLKELKQQTARIRAGATENNIAAIRRARGVLAEQWPALQATGQAPQLATDAEALRDLLGSDRLYEHMARVASLVSGINTAYADLYQRQHGERFEGYARARNDIRNRQEWEQVPEASRVALLAPITARICQREADLSESATTCAYCHATQTQIESDLAALGGYTSQVLARIDEIVAPAPTRGGGPSAPIRRVRAASYFASPIDTTDSVDEALRQMRDDLYKLVEQGSRIIVE